MMALTCRRWLAVWLSLATAVSYKVSDAPIEITSTNDTTIKEKVEKIAAKNLEEEFKEINDIPNPENVTTNTSNASHGFGEMGRNFEFMMLKMAQLETLCELQQVEIESLKTTVKGLAKHVDYQDSVMSLLQKDESARVQEAQHTLKRVLIKHGHQHKTNQFHPMPARQGRPEAKPEATSQAEAMLLKRRKTTKADTASLDSAVSAKGIPIVDDVKDFAEDRIEDVKSVAESTADAYEQVADKVAFIAQTTIDTVEMAVQILLKGFTDWNAGCADPVWPKIEFYDYGGGGGGSGIHVDFGKQNCWVRLMGQTVTLFNWNFGRKWVPWPEPVKAAVKVGSDIANAACGDGNFFECMGMQIVEHIAPLNAAFTLGKDLVECTQDEEPLDLIKCIGLRLLQELPPLNFLSRLGEIFSDFIGTFAEIAKNVVRNALDKGLGMVQTAATSAFPEIGAQPAVHYDSKNLVIKTHSQSAHQGTGVKEPKRMSKLQTGANASRAGGDDDKQDSVGAITFEIGPYGPATTGLITQFEGKETHTGSCLAFAPRTKTGTGNQATKQDWRVDSNDQFLQLEPWAVPCDNAWMQRNWDKWQGYTFYTTRSNIEKCMTVTFSLGLQPVLAFVGGLQFDVLPTPFFEVDIQICWPKEHPGGVDISALHFEFRSVGILLLSRTMRLTKRFGDNADFAGSNLNHGTATSRSQLGLPRLPGSDESTSAIKSMSRIKASSSELLQNSSHDDKAEEEVAMQWADAEELYLASVEYGPNMSVNTTSELRGPAAHRRLSAMQTQESKEEHQLFHFNSGGHAISFDLEGLLSNNDLELGVKMGFGPFESPRVRIPLLNIVDQFRAVLRTLPFVTPSSIEQAVAALSDFSQQGIDGAANMETVTHQAGVCSSWQLRIAEDNPKGWEAHIFEIELFNGDDLISGPGKGTASSDCKNWAGGPEGAFDGDLSTKWVTCSSAAKVGKGITYKLNQPNAVTKVKTHQWGSANNAIPKFDLYCSTDDATFTYVWTADLGNGVSTKEATAPQ